MTKRQGIWSVIGLIVLANAIVFALVGSNRRGDPLMTITMTEREWHLPNFRGNDNLGADIARQYLTLDWNEYSQPRLSLEENETWFDRAKLEIIGFDCSMSPGDSLARRFYHSQLGRFAFVVLEYDGVSWQSWQESLKAGRTTTKPAPIMEFNRSHVEPVDRVIDSAAVDSIQEEQFQSHSRLFAIDVGPDPRQLRQKYPDAGRFIILRGLVDARIADLRDSSDNIVSVLRGRIRDLAVPRVFVPHRFRSLIESIAAEPLRDTPGLPRFTVRIAIGKSWEPWVRDIQPIPRTTE